jgi:hypothetical protein
MSSAATGTRALRGFVFVMGLFAAAHASAQPGPSGKMERRLLSADTVIDGVPCAHHARIPAEFHPDGALGGCLLSREHVVGPHRFPVNSWLDFTPQHVLWQAWLSANTTLDGHTCRGDGYKQWSVRFHTNGRLAGCYLARDTLIAGVPCMRGTFLNEIRGGSRTALRLYANGSFRQCQAARAVGDSIRKWQVVRRDSALP